MRNMAWGAAEDMNRLSRGNGIGRTAMILWHSFLR